MSPPAATDEVRGERMLDFRLIRRLMSYLSQHWVLITVALVLMLAADLLQVLHPYLIKIGIDDNVTAGDVDGLLRIATLLGFTLLGSFLVSAGFTWVVEYLGQRLLFDLRLDLFRKVLRLGSDYFDKTPVGSTLTNITNDVEAIRQFISQGIVTIVGDVLKVAFILGAMVLINPRLAGITFLTLPLFIVATILFRNAIRSGFRGVRRANAEINTSLVETITGIREITLFNYQQPSLRRFSGYNRHYLDAYLDVVRSYAIYFPSIDVVANISMVVVLVFAHFGIGVSVAVGDVFAFFTYINMLFRPLRQLAEQFNAFQSAMAASERIFALLDRRESIVSPATPVAITPPAAGRITFDGVEFGYDTNNPILRQLSFEIEPNQRIAIVGATGAGKTTIINLINRLYDVTGGRILLDGVDLREIDLEKLRGHIATVPQDLFLFSGSVADNISLRKPGIDRAAIEAAARAVNAAHFVERFPDGYDENVLEEGKSLSTGQKQLLSFARAFVLDPTVVIMDEATSNIDTESEKLIEGALDTLLTGRTAIIIAHRLSTIRSADRILVLHKGELVEDGSHEQLLADGGVYSQLYELQLLALND